jgi:hypothetical protein
MSWLGFSPLNAFRVFSTVLIAMACGIPLNAAEWSKLETPRYTIISHVPDRLTRSVASDLDDFLGLFNRLVVVEPRSLQPLTIVLFDGDSELDPYKPLTPDGINIDWVSEEKAEVWTTSVTGSRNGWMAVAVAAQAGITGEDYNFLTRRAVLTGVVRWYLEAMKTPVPPAVTFGMQRLFSDYRREITHGVLGNVTPDGEGRKGQDSAIILGHWPLIPVKQLLAMTQMEAITGHNRVVFDQESWALVEYLLFSKWSTERHAFTTFWGALGDGFTPEEALVKALGPDGAANIDTDLSAFLHSMRYVVKIEMGKEVENKDPIVPADPMDVAIALTKATMISGHGSPVSDADAAVAASHGRSEAYDIRAEALAASKAAPVDVEKAVEDALAHGSHGAFTAWEYAAYRFSQIGDPAASPKETRAVVNLAEKAANLDFRYRASFDLLAKALVFSDHVTDDDAKFMEFARTNFPWDRWILIGQSAIHARTGDSEGARQLRERAVSDDRTLNPKQLAEVKAFVALKGVAAPVSPAGGGQS